ncbi:MAG: hypothetical protein KGM45_02975 [Actinomycetales bacterium]|nr:hypothetical protein [Actinomycetales bacterium]
MEIGQIRSRWNDVLDALESNNRVAWIAYFDARLISFENGVITLDFSDSRKFATSHEYSQTRPNLKAALIASIDQVLGLKVEIREQ